VRTPGYHKRRRGCDRGFMRGKPIPSPALFIRIPPNILKQDSSSRFSTKKHQINYGILPRDHLLITSTSGGKYEYYSINCPCARTVLKDATLFHEPAWIVIKAAVPLIESKRGKNQPCASAIMAVHPTQLEISRL
jgi:hypothetical protein